MKLVKYNDSAYERTVQYFSEEFSIDKELITDEMIEKYLDETNLNIEIRVMTNKAKESVGQ